MSEELLEPTAAAPAAALLESLEKQAAALEQLVRILLDQVGAAAERLMGSGLAFEDAWRRIVLDVAGGRTAEIQSDRPRLAADVEQRLELLKRTYALVRQLRQSHAAEGIPDPDVLLSEIARLERLKTEVFDRWHTTEDLERLAVEHYPLSQSQLRQVAATHSPPPEWYAGEEEVLFEE